jgi:hypothetical protein
MKFKEYLKELIDFAEKNPSSLEMDVIYSRDDEGNGYQLVNDGAPAMGMFADEGEFYIEEDEEYLVEEGMIEKFEFNAIIIN